MKKGYRFNELSIRTCEYHYQGYKLCNKKLKLRLVHTKPTANLCHKHYRQLRRMGISDQKIKRGEY